jgi:hypothetical protein
VSERKWRRDKFLIALPEKPERLLGWTYRGLGLDQRGRTEWVVTHLGTGYRICKIKGPRFMAFQIATEIAECGEWDFIGISGHLNRDPELRKKAGTILAAYCETVEWKKSEHTGSAFHVDDGPARRVMEMLS